jgi:hypothetical protein
MVEKKDNSELSAELSCGICWNIMWQPVTTPCGHTFCKECLYQTLQRKRECTICRAEIFKSSIANLPVNVVLTSLIEKMEPEAIAQRKKEWELERENARKNVLPSNTGFNSIPVLVGVKLHVFKNMTTRIRVDPKIAVNMKIW